MGVFILSLQPLSVADLGVGPRLLFLDQTEARRAEKNFLETEPPPPLSQDLDGRPPLI